MGWGHLDIAVRISAIAALLLLAWLLLRQWRAAGVPALLFAPMALCLSGFLTGNTPDPALRLSGWPGAAAHLASGCAVVFLWWFCLACFDKAFRLRGAVLAVGLCWIALAVADRVTGDALPFSPILVALGFGIVAHLVWRLYAEREGDLIQKRYDARAMVAVLLGGLLLTDLLVDLFLGFAWRPLPFALAQNAAILGIAVWLAARLLDVRPGVLSFEGLPCPIAVAATEESALQQRLRSLIVERVHLDPELSFADFVKRMGAPERTVRTFINHELGFDHFRSFLNHYRLQEARTLLADPQRAGDKLIAIALDSGFASLPSFNRVFRAGEGCTPSAYRAAALAATVQNAPVQGFEKRSAAF